MSSRGPGPGRPRGGSLPGGERVGDAPPGGPAQQEGPVRAARKDEHVELALRLHGQDRPNAFDDLAFMHHALAGTATAQVDTSTTVCGARWELPFYINAMTGGTPATTRINADLAGAAAESGVAIACGSQHVALTDPERAEGFRIIRRQAPRAFILANAGPALAPDQAVRAVEMLEADALQIHLNAAQEIVMPEGDRDFRDWPRRIAAIVEAVPVPVIVKEVGFGLSARTLDALTRLGVAGADVAGSGGTDFIAIENERRPERGYSYLSGWGQSAALCLLEAMHGSRSRPGGKAARPGLELLASGGVRHPLDVVRALALGARAVGASGHFLRTLTGGGPEALRRELDAWGEHLRSIMALLGSDDVEALTRTDLLVTGRTAEQARLLGIDLGALAHRSA
ncbi:type 2 isopentenyl-diphosphate Delta-isomerase [Actinomyces bowdenii]|nr:type 2 isopentenyl-diphosphate Delta-isomerase [Actinomyces bowdenii]